MDVFQAAQNLVDERLEVRIRQGLATVMIVWLSEPPHSHWLGGVEEARTFG